MEERILLTEVTVAYVMIKAVKGEAINVARRVSELDGVRWASVITGCQDVIAGVRVSDNDALGELVVNGIQTIEGVNGPETLVMSSHYVGGAKVESAHNGPP
jgi:DNA-binding Lrp family transcriptional regulator